MKAVILVGGKGTRLLPLTSNTPKAMVPVLNTPFLKHVIRYLQRHHIKDIVLAQGHLAQSMESYLGDGSQLEVKLYYSFEDTPLGTAGAVKNSERYLDHTFLVLNGDVFTDQDITAMVKFHYERRAIATIALTPVEDPTSYGLIETRPDGRVTRFLEKPKLSEVTTNTINAGAYIVEPEVIAQIQAHVNISFEHEVFLQLLAHGKPVYGYSSPAYWMDMGTPERYFQLHYDLLSGKCRGYDLVPNDDIVTGNNSSVHHTIQAKGQVVIGANCSIGPRVKLNGPVVIGNGCIIEEDVAIEKSIIWDEVRVEKRAKVRNSIVANSCRLETDCSIEESILGDNITIGSKSKLEAGSKIWPWSIIKSRK